MIVFLRYPILILKSYYLNDTEFKKYTKYCFYIRKFKINSEFIYIFEFKNINLYIKFCKDILKKEKIIKLCYLKEFEIKKIDTIIEENGKIKIKFEDSKVYYTTDLKIIYTMIDVLYNKGETNITDFNEILHNKRILDNKKSITDKRQMTTYIKYWYLPYRILLEYSKETGDIYITKPNKNESKIIFINNKNLLLIDIKDRFYRWLLDKIRG